jgi:hypothetical protein
VVDEHEAPEPPEPPATPEIETAPEVEVHEADDVGLEGRHVSLGGLEWRLAEACEGEQPSRPRVLLFASPGEEQELDDDPALFGDARVHGLLEGCDRVVLFVDGLPEGLAGVGHEREDRIAEGHAERQRALTGSEETPLFVVVDPEGRVRAHRSEFESAEDFGQWLGEALRAAEGEAPHEPPNDQEGEPREGPDLVERLLPALREAAARFLPPATETP